MDELIWLALGGGAAYLVLRQRHKMSRKMTRGQMPIGAVPPPQGPGATILTSGGEASDPNTYPPAPGVGVGASYVGAPYRGAVYDPAGTAGGGFGLAAPAFAPYSHASYGASRTPGGGIGYGGRLPQSDVAYARTWGASPTEDCVGCKGAK